MNFRGFLKREVYKFILSRSIYIFFGFLALLIIGYGLLYENNSENEDWRSSLIEQNEMYEERLENDVIEGDRIYLQRQIDQNNQYLENNINPNSSTQWGFVNYSNFLIIFIIIYTVIVSTSIYTRERENGTLYHLLRMPINKPNIILAKGFTVMSFISFITILFLILTNTIGGLLYGFNFTDNNYVDVYDLSSKYLLINNLLYLTGTLIDLFIVVFISLFVAIILNRFFISFIISIVMLFGLNEFLFLNINFYQSISDYFLLGILGMGERLLSEGFNTEILLQLSSAFFQILLLLAFAVKVFNKRYL